MANDDPDGTRSLRARARLVHTLGSELISNEQVAIIELVKNGYDADATRVVVRFGSELLQGSGFVEVWDDGHGMTRATVDEVWSDIATPFRLASSRSEAGNRRVLGEKGIGRLAASRLGSETVLVSRREHELEVALRIDWEQFTDDVYLDDVEFEVGQREPRVFTEDGEASEIFARTAEHGTVVRTERLGRTWEKADFERLKLALSRLLPPRADPALGEVFSERFAIELRVPISSGTVSGDVGPNDVTSLPHYQVVGTVATDGRIDVTYRAGLTGETRRIESRVAIRDGSDDREPTCGPIQLDLRVWDLDRAGYDFSRRGTQSEYSSIRQYRDDVKSRSGVALYRDGFRVQPFGDSTFDWLNLDARRVNNPTQRVSNNQVSGFVFITAENNPGLRDRSHREGLIDTRGFEDLKLVVLQVLAELEARRRAYRDDIQRPESRKRADSGVFSRFELTGLKALAESRPEDKELAVVVAEVTSSVEGGVDEVKRTLARFSKLATLGSLVDIILHEGRTPLSRVMSGIKNILGETPGSADMSAADRVAKFGNRIQEGAAMLSDLFGRIEPLSGRQRGNPTPESTEVLIDNTLAILESRIRRAGIQVERVGVSHTVEVVPGEVAQVLINLIDNAIYWLAEVPKDKRRLRVSSSVVNSEWTVLVEDSGPGVASELRPSIFDAYFTTKPDGTGLGLAIAGSTVQDFYDGSLELLNSGDLGGATFRATFKSRIG